MPAIVQRTVLVVDDIPSVRFYHQYILEKSGYRCVVARDGAEALQKLQAEPVDLVLLDIVMPNLTGLEFIQQVRNNPAFVQLPILVISSERIGDKVRQERTATAGPVGYAQKPLFPEIISAEIHRLLETT
jgi:CheY-like chemotaxis protein